MVTEAKNWIRQNYGTKFTIVGNTEHVTSLPKVTAEEESCRNELNDYVIDKFRLITTNENNRPKQKSFLQIATGKGVDHQKEEKNKHAENTMNSNTMQCENMSEASKEEEEVMTHESQNTVQMKLIKDLQEFKKVLHSSR